MSKTAKTSDRSGTSQRAAAHGNAARQSRQAGGPGTAIDTSPRMTTQRRRTMEAFGEAAQRVEEEEPLQGKFDAAQRVEEEEPLQGKFDTSQRVEDEEPLQGKFDAAQRVEDEEPLQGKFDAAQRMEDEEPLQGKFDAAQRVEEEEPLQGKFDAAQRVEDEEPLQGKFDAAQRVEEEEPLQGKFDAAQRVEEEEPLQGKFDTAQRMEEEEPLQGKFDTSQRAEDEELLQAKGADAPANKTGMPDQLKAGIESMSGMDLSDVKVHRNSGKAADLQAHAYAQGNDIHVAPGQEQHLPHEAWHVVQQRQGRVKPTMQLQGVAVNDDVSLEHEADVMGAKALQRASDPTLVPPRSAVGEPRRPVTQRRLVAHAKKNDEGTTVARLGDVGFLAEYSKLLADDPSVLVDGKPPGETGLTKTLKEAKVDGGALSGDFVASIMGSGSWLPSGEAFRRSLVEYVRSQDDTLPEVGSEEDNENETDEQYMRAYVFGTDYAEHVEKWITDTAGLDGTTTVDQVNGRASKVPLDWKSDLAYLVYEQTKTSYYGTSLKAAYVAPFKAMIGDVNSGAIESFDFVEKYGSEANNNLGAEFTVGGPPPMVDKYSGKAVLHTHYGAEDESPNYGHTKPYEQRFAPGFGYTIVSEDAINDVDDSQSRYQDL
jgi:hypothetical protein